MPNINRTMIQRNLVDVSKKWSNNIHIIPKSIKVKVKEVLMLNHSFQ